MHLLILLGAFTKLDAPVNAPGLRRSLISILYDGCMRCINLLVNISIFLYGGGWMGCFDAPHAPELGTYRFLGTFDAPLMHPRYANRYAEAVSSCTLNLKKASEA